MKSKALRATFYDFSTSCEMAFVYSVYLPEYRFVSIGQTRSIHGTFKRLSQQIKIDDQYSHLEQGIGQLKKLLSQPNEDFAILSFRLMENIQSSRLWGDSDNARRERNEIIYHLDGLSFRLASMSFMDFCDTGGVVSEIHSHEMRSNADTSTLQRKICDLLGFESYSIESMGFFAVPLDARPEFIGESHDYRDGTAYLAQEALRQTIYQSGIQVVLIPSYFSRNYTSQEFVRQEGTRIGQNLIEWLSIIHQNGL